MKKLSTSLLSIIFFNCTLHAQNSFGSFLVEHDKLVVVVMVLVTIFLGITFFLVYLDKRLKKIEDKISKHK